MSTALTFVGCPSFVVSKGESIKITYTFADAYHFRAPSLDMSNKNGNNIWIFDVTCDELP
jgi:hypothetical protein